MERDGWSDSCVSLLPPRPLDAPPSPDLPALVTSDILMRYLLYLLRSHDGYVEFKWIKAHSGDVMNSLADELAKQAALSCPHIFSLASISFPPDWVDIGPVLNHQSLSFLTDSIVSGTVIHPVMDDKSADFCRRWSSWASGFSSGWLDVTHHIPNIWKINIPTQLRELLWKEINDSLPLGHSWASKVRWGQCCPCTNHVLELDQLCTSATHTLTTHHVWIRPRCEASTSLRANRCRCGSGLYLPRVLTGGQPY